MTHSQKVFDTQFFLMSFKRTKFYKVYKKKKKIDLLLEAIVVTLSKEHGISSKHLLVLSLSIFNGMHQALFKVFGVYFRRQALLRG